MICQDYELWSSLMRKGFRVTNIPDILVVIRHYTDSISFREQDRQNIENGKILLENIASLTTLKLSFEDALRQRLFFAMPDKLSMDNFKKAEDLFLKEYRNLCNESMLDQNSIRLDLKRKLVKPYCKMAIYMMRNGHFRETQRTIRDYIVKYGISAMPLLIWVISYGGKNIFYKMLSFFEMWQSISAKYYYHAKRNPKS